MKAHKLSIGLLLGSALVCMGAQAEAPEPLGRQTTQMSAQGPETVRRVQAALAQQGYQPGEINGQFTRQTEQALKQAQADMGMRRSGQLDQETLFKLGVTAWVPSENEQVNK